MTLLLFLLIVVNARFKI